MRFCAIDFETANNKADSACAVGLALADETRILRQYYSLIRTPSDEFWFTDIHGISWSDVEGERLFGAVWPDMAALIDSADLLVAHNASFDRGVLRAGCAGAGVPPPEQPFACTLKLARAVWKKPKGNALSALAKDFGIPLDHHNALSDAHACARILQRALADGGRIEDALLEPRAARERAAASAPAAPQPSAPQPAGALPAMLKVAGLAGAAALLLVP